MTDSNGNTDHPLPVWHKALDSLDKLSWFIIVINMMLLVVLVISEVFSRYALDASIGAADEMARFCFIWSMFLAIPHGIKYGSHVGIDLVIVRIPQAPRSVIFRLLSFGSMILMLMVAYQGVLVAIAVWDQMMPTIDISNGVFYIPIVVCGLHSAMHLAYQTISGKPIERSFIE
jgi:TRAP-type C4-dicarboxylate transport system permease small subunit